MTSNLKGTSQPKTFSFEWTIKRFFADCQNVGDCYRSPMYPILYGGQLTKWRLKVYPKGINEDNKDDVSLYLCFSSETEIEVTVDYELSILSQQNCALDEIADTNTFKGPSEDFSWGNFVEQNALKDPKSGALIEDLTITCEITFHPQAQDDAKRLSGYNDWLDEIKNGFGDYEQLLESGNFSDVTFNLQDKQINLHKAILSCRSPVFKAMFEHDMKENKQNAVDITDIDYDVMKELFRFLYSGKVKNIEKIASQLLIAADKYQVIELKALCEKTLYDKLTVENVVEYLKLIEMCDTIYLKSLVINFSADHYKDVIEQPGFKDLHSHVMHKILQAVAKNN